MRVLILGSLPCSLVNFRGPLIKRLVEDGNTVIAASGSSSDNRGVAKTLRSWGVDYHSVDIARTGTNPLADFRTYNSIRALLRKTRPDALLAYTAKPVIYGGMAVRSLPHVRFFPMIEGLGYAFTSGAGKKRRILRLVLKTLYRQGLRGADRVFFLNQDDEELFIQLGLIAGPNKSIRIDGCGVDRTAFPKTQLPDSTVFFMAARLVSDKGVREYAEAARRVRAVCPHAEFRLAGGLDDNLSGIKQAELEAWAADEDVKVLGPVHPIQPEFANCRYYVLPSYREGVPRSTLEAMATGRPIITTDAPGCRETVEHGVNGLLVPPRDPDALASAMLELLSSPQERIQSMADESLRMARERFDVHRVNDEILAVLGL